jgi:2-dehydropantoate 2-reductase
MKIAAMGAGGVGGYFGARLQQAGHDVAFFARGKHLAAIREKGLTIESPQGNARLKVKVFEDPAEAGQVDAVMFAVKLWDTETAAAQIKPIIGKRTVVIPLQNGVESIDVLRTLLPASAVMGGSAYIATRVREPGVIEHTGNMSRLQFGALLASQHNAADAFLAACRQAGLNAELCDDIVRANWEKFVFLVGVSSATAVTRKPLGAVRADADMRWLFEQAMRETWQLARKRGVALPDDFVESRLAFADTLHTEMRASLLHDLEAGNKLEAPWLCGAVARMSAQAGLDAPVNRAVFAALKPYLNGK